MASASAADVVPRVLGQAVFLVWCGVVAVALSVVTLLRLGWVTATGGRGAWRP